MTVRAITNRASGIVAGSLAHATIYQLVRCLIVNVLDRNGEVLQSSIQVSPRHVISYAMLCYAMLR